MGMFDEISFRCPACKSAIIVQSKAGECELMLISCSEVPIVIADDIRGTSVYCESCGTHSKVFMPVKIETVELGLHPAD